MSPCFSISSFFIASFKGPSDQPSPITSSVTPCLISLCDRPSSISDLSAQLSIFINPGATAFPPASISVIPWAFLRLPTAAMVSPFIARSPLYDAEPDPSQTSPFRIITSYLLLLVQLIKSRMI